MVVKLEIAVVNSAACNCVLVVQVCEAKRLVLQSEVMQEELHNCQHSDYTADSLPLLLHQVRQHMQCPYHLNLVLQ